MAFSLNGPIQEDALSKYDSIVTIKFVSASDNFKLFEDFRVHRGLITQCSEYFRAALEKENFQEGKVGIIELPIDDLEPFKMFLAWAYQRSMLHGGWAEPMDPCITAFKTSKKDNDGKAARLMSRYVHAWVYGDMRQAPEFQDWVMYQLIAGAKEIGFYINECSVKYAYDHTMPGSLLRKYLVDTCAANGRPSSFQEQDSGYQDFPKSFTEEMVVVLMTKGKSAAQNYRFDPSPYLHKVER